MSEKLTDDKSSNVDSSHREADLEALDAVRIEAAKLPPDEALASRSVEPEIRQAAMRLVGGTMANQGIEYTDAWEDTGGGDRPQMKLAEKRHSLEQNLHALYPLTHDDDQQLGVPGLIRAMADINELSSLPQASLSGYVKEELEGFRKRHGAQENSVKTVAAVWMNEVSLLINALQRVRGASDEASDDFRADHPSQAWQTEEGKLLFLKSLDDTFNIILVLNKREIKSTFGSEEERHEAVRADQKAVEKWLKDLQDEIAEKGGIASKPSVRSTRSSLSRRENRIREAKQEVR